MATDLPVSFRASPLPSNFKGSPQQLQDAIVARLALVTSDQLALFVNGATEPSSDSGPWIKNGITWYVWDVVTGAYIPQVIDFESLRYSASATEPDPTKYVFWIELDGAGKAVSLKYYSGGAWKSVYEDAAAATALSIKTYLFRGDLDGDQSTASNTGPLGEDLTLTYTETFDPDGVFDGTTFTAPVDGYYHFDCKLHFESTAGTPTGNFIYMQLVKNTFGLANEIVFDEIVDAELGGRTYTLSTNVQLVAGDEITVQFQTYITAGTGVWTAKSDNTYFSGFKLVS